MAGSWLRAAATASIAAALAFPPAPAAAALFLTADADIRHRGTGPDVGPVVAAVGVGVRNVFPDSKGDRVTVFALLESLEDFERTQFDQAYLLYKGPLGRWNVTAGRYLVPYGLLTSYSSKRLLVDTVERHTVGVEADNGVMFSGFAGSFEYAASVSEGVGVGKWWDDDARGILTARVGWEGTDYEVPKPGFSVAFGKAVSDHHGRTMGGPTSRRMAAVDVTWERGLSTMRAEAGAGRQGSVNAHSVFAGVDHSLFGNLALNGAWAWYRDVLGRGSGLYAGATLDILGLKARASYKFALEKEGEDELAFQLYWYFSRTR